MTVLSSGAALSGSRLFVIFLLLCTAAWTSDLWLPSQARAKWSVPSSLRHTNVSSTVKPHRAHRTHFGHTYITTATETATATVTAPVQATTVIQQTTVTAVPTSLPGEFDACLNAPGADSVMIVLKTGASEIYTKLPVFFMSLFRCTPNYMIFSDLHQDFGDHVINDALADVSEEYKGSHEDFELYRMLQRLQGENQDLAELKGAKSWNLDKWKFLPMIHKTYELAPETIDWFVFIEADTSLSWGNLLQWLAKMNPREELYLGAPNVIGETVFAHGGSGIVVSRPALHKLEQKRKDEPDWDKKWEHIISTSCCGDEVLARAFLDAGVPLKGAWPMIQGERVNTIDYTDRHWCSPPVTFHHVTPSEVDSMWQFQTDWVKAKGYHEPYLYRDIFSTYIKEHVTGNRTAWNNMSQNRKIVSPNLPDRSEDDIKRWDESSELERAGVESFEACATACHQLERECSQWMWSPGRCYLDKEIRLGMPDTRETEKWESGWRHERVDALSSQQEHCQINWHG